jgi:hypothetical protein
MSIQKALEKCNWKSRRAFYVFMSKTPKAQEIFRAACQMRAEGWAEELIDIADSTPAKEAKKGALQVDTRKWIISKHLPKTYGDKLGLEHSGKDGKELYPPTINVNFVKP